MHTKERSAASSGTGSRILPWASVGVHCFAQLGAERSERVGLAGRSLAQSFPFGSTFSVNVIETNVGVRVELCFSCLVSP